MLAPEEMAEFRSKHPELPEQYVEWKVSFGLADRTPL
jgi:hypothetical protein